MSFFTFSREIQHISILCEEWKNYTNSDGTGAYWEVIKRVYEPLDIKVETQTLPWSRAKQMVKNRHADAYLGDYFSDDHGDDYLYPNWHISIEDPVIVVFKEKFEPQWTRYNINALSGKKVSWIRGYGFDSHFLNKVSVIPVTVGDIQQALELLRMDRIDFFLDYRSHIDLLNIKHKRIYKEKIAKLGEKLFVVFSNTPRSETLLEIFDRRMHALSKSGEIEQIYIKYGLTAEKFSKDRFSRHKNDE